MGDERGSSTAVLLAFLGGAALGAVAALLLAPQSGRETREQLRGYARRAEEGLSEAAGQAGDVVEDVIHEGKEFMAAQKSVLREAMDAGREAIQRERDRRRGEGSSQA